MIELKSPQELEIMRENANILGRILNSLESSVNPGLTTAELDRSAEQMVQDANATPAFKGYQGYPSTLCTSINEEIVHGIPSDDRFLSDGDILSMDIGLRRRGYFADAATTVPVGEIDDSLSDILNTADEALTRAAEQVKQGNRVSDISNTIESYVSERGYYVVKEFVGHGIGKDLHEDPQIPNFGKSGTGARIREGMVLAIEPMVKTDEEAVEVLDDGWTAVTHNREPSSHFEGMVAVTNGGPEILVRGGG